MKPSTKYGLLAIATLSIVSMVHMARTQGSDWPEPFRYLLGVLPNTAAAMGLPFAFISVWCGQNPSFTHATLRRWFVAASLFSVAGLIVWEFLQPSRGRVFDMHDIAATCAGFFLALLLFHTSTGNPSSRLDGAL